MSDTIVIKLSFIYANEADRVGAVGLIPDDIGKFAKQSDNLSYWELLNNFPVTWGALSSSTVNATDVALADVIVNGETRLSETVIGIQNIPISSEVPIDGYSLVYDGYFNQWQPKLLQKSIYHSNLTNFQNTNLNSGDHVMFDNILFSLGNNITLDASSPYSTSPGPSIGRITLAANHTYKLVGDLSTVNGTGSGYVWLQWTNVTTNQNIGAMVYGTDKYNLVSDCVAYITTDVETLVELRFISISGINQLGDVSGGLDSLPWFTVDEV